MLRFSPVGALLVLLAMLLLTGCESETVRTVEDNTGVIGAGDGNVVVDKDAIERPVFGGGDNNFAPGPDAGSPYVADPKLQATEEENRRLRAQLEAEQNRPGVGTEGVTNFYVGPDGRLTSKYLPSPSAAE